MTLHISWARADAEWRKVMRCPTEGKPRPMYARYQDWYGWEVTCLGCGEQWQDGEQLERPFRPRWRQENIDRATAALLAMQADFIDHHPPDWRP